MFLATEEYAEAKLAVRRAGRECGERVRAELVYFGFSPKNPRPPLSGEYADDLTPAHVAEIAGINPYDPETATDLDDLCETFEEAYYAVFDAE